MIGLLLNDVLNIRKQAIWYLAMILIFCIASVVMKNEAFSGAIGLMVGISIPITAMAYEERDGWQKFVVASGVRVQTIVGEKFLLGLLFSAIGWIGNAVAFPAPRYKADIPRPASPAWRRFPVLLRPRRKRPPCRTNAPNPHCRNARRNTGASSRAPARPPG